MKKQNRRPEEILVGIEEQIAKLNELKDKYSQLLAEEDYHWDKL